RAQRAPPLRPAGFVGTGIRGWLLTPICYVGDCSSCMPFHIQPIREFLVRPTLPESLSRLSEVAHNLLWSWEPIVRALFRRLDPPLWRGWGYHPGLMLGRVP